MYTYVYAYIYIYIYTHTAPCHNQDRQIHMNINKC